MTSYAAGRRAARTDHVLRGAKFTKRKAGWGLIGHSEEFNRGYRDYARYRCPVRREVI